MNSLYLLLDLILILITWLVVAWIILTLLVQLNVVDPRHEFVKNAQGFLTSVLSPLLYPIHQWLTRIFPKLVGVNLAPIVLLLLVYFIRSLLSEYWPSL